MYRDIRRVLDSVSEHIPENYICLDFETTGLKFDYRLASDRYDYVGDVVVEIGKCSVAKHKSDYYENTILDWTRDELVPEQWLQDRFEQCRAAMAKRGRDYQMSLDKMKSEGEDAIDALNALRLEIDEALKLGKIVGFNFFGFDRHVLSDSFLEWCDAEFFVDGNSIFDLGLLEKASKIGMLRLPGETLDSFWQRVSEKVAKGVTWNLDSCVKKYELRKWFDTDGLVTHNAGVDAMFTHLMLNEVLGI